MRRYLQELNLLPKGVKQFLMSEPFLGIAFGLHAMLFNLHLLAYELNEVQIGQITALGSINMAVFAVPFGLVADRVGRKKVLFSGLLMISISYYLIALGQSFLHFAFAQSVLSLGLSMMVSAEIPLLFHYCQSKKEQTQTYNMMFAVFTLFIGIGTLLGGFLPSWLDPQHDHYRNTMLVMALSITAVTVARFFLPNDYRTKQKSEYQRKWTLKQMIPQRMMMIYVGFSFFAGVSFAVVMPFLNLMIKFRLDWPDPMVATVLTINGLFLFVASFFTPYWLDRWGLKKVAYALFFLTFFMSVSLALMLPVSMFLVFFFLRSGMYTALYNVIEGQALQATRDDQRSLHASLRSIGRSLGQTLGAYITGYILAAQNYWLPFLVSGCVVALSFFYFRWLMLAPLEQDLQKENHDS